MTRTTEYDEGEPMTAIGLVGVTSLLLSCGVHPDDLGEAWSVARALKHEAEYPSQMAPLVRHLRQYAHERNLERARAAAGTFGRHTGPIALT